MKYTDEERFQKIYSTAVKLQDYLRQNNVGKDDLLNSLSLKWLVTTPLNIIGDQIYHLSQSYKETRQEIKWMRLSGLENLLETESDEINWHLIADIVFDDLPHLITESE